MGHFLSVRSGECPFSPFGEKGWFSTGQNGHFGLRVSIGHLSIFRTASFLSFRQRAVRVASGCGKTISRPSFPSYRKCKFIVSLFAITGPAAIIQAVYRELGNTQRPK